MSDTLAGTKRRRAPNEDQIMLGASSEHGAVEARKRRAFLHTMGQQLREFRNEGVSPQDQSRNTFPSPGGRPESRAASSTVSQTTAQPQEEAILGEDDQLPAGAVQSASKWLWQAAEVDCGNSQRPRIPVAFEDLLDWSQSYFDHWHPSFPFLHAPAILDHFQEIAPTVASLSNTVTSSTFENIILRSVVSISTMDRRQMAPSHKPVPSALVFHTFNDAINTVKMVLTEESSILSLQALVSVQLFLISMHRYNAASRLQGIAAHLAFQLRLHRCPARTLPHSDKEVELRKRLFWSVFCIDRYISVRLGNPSVISSDDVDVCYPQSERHKETAGDIIEHDDRLDLIDFLARHAEIRGSIMKMRNKTTVDGEKQVDDHVLLVETEHAKWWTMVDEHLSDHKLMQSIAKPHQVALIVLRFETILALHRSVLGNTRHDTMFNVALQRCVTASRSIINTLHKALQGFGAFDGSPGQHGYESTPLLWPSFTWALWMSTFVIVFAASEQQLPRNIALRLADRSVEVLHHIALRGTSWPESCIVAIRDLVARLRQPTDSAAPLPQPRIIEGSASRNRGRVQVQAMVQDEQPTIHHSGSNHNVQGQMSQIPAPVTRITSETSLGPGFVQDPGCLDLGVDGPYNVLRNTGNQGPLVGSGNHLNGSGDFLGIAQHLSDVPRPNDDITQLFSGEDLSWWIGTDYGLNRAL